MNQVDTASSTQPADRRATLLLVLCLSAALAPVFVFGGPHATTVLATILFEAAGPAAVLALATLLGMTLTRPLAKTANLPLRIATGGVVGIGVLVTCIFVLGVSWMLDDPAVKLFVGVLGAVGLLGIGWQVVRAGRDDKLPVLAEWRPSAGAWLWPLACVSLGMAMVAATMPAGTMWGGEPNGYDVVSYHLTIPQAWYEAGNMAPLGNNVFSYMPLATETLFLVLVYFAGDTVTAMYACHFLNVGIGVLFVVGIYGAVLGDDGSRRLPATIAAVFAACVPWTVMLSSIAYNEPLVMLGGAVSAGWLLRTLDDPKWSTALLAGLAASVAASGKYTAIPMLCVGGALVLAWPSRRRFVATAVFAVASIVFVAPWLVDNWFWAGNPVFPLAHGTFGGPFSDVQAERWTASHTLAEGASRWRNLLTQVVATANYGWVVWPAAIAGAVLLIGAKKPAAQIVALPVFGLIVWLTATHAQGRFLVLILPAALVLTGLLPWQKRVGVSIAIAATACVAMLASTAFVAAGLENRRGLWGMTAAARANLDVAVFGAPGLNFLTPPTFPTDLGDRRVYLVGDAKALVYQPGDVRYRTVFNVPEDGEAVTAWLGEAWENGPDDAIVVVHRGEIERLHKTYGTPLTSWTGPGVTTLGELRRNLRPIGQLE